MYRRGYSNDFDKVPYLQCYVGYDGTLPTPTCSIGKQINITMTLLGNDNPADSIQCTTNLSIAEGKGERIDSGEHKVVSIDNLDTPRYTEDEKFRVQITLLEEFRPAVVPLNYDSKASTGMLGLINQGATCYLNALLQVA